MNFNNYTHEGTIMFNHQLIVVKLTCNLNIDILTASYRYVCINYIRQSVNRAFSC